MAQVEQPWRILGLVRVARRFEISGSTSLRQASSFVDPFNLLIIITDGADVNDRGTPVRGHKAASRMVPRPHQEEALRAIRETSESRALVVMACGTGKSLVARETANTRAPGAVLVTVPTLALADQIYRG
ncbi:hypothetical protein FRZ00_21255 [Streptomyces mobaraensis]|uniref:Helicase/UvrB N-terminal domain-containing protein n=1 Tax=Streptomyces mobaraensis TaxID=35621 RepID=A0A5N5W576_STRMB|nr:hypothetical protein FRZ00_21255 [Streptomyces mobaraensis]